MAEASTSETTRLRFGVLGPLTVTRKSAEIPLAGGRQKALLTFLLLHANRVVPTDRLVDELFGDQPPEGAVNSVHAGISRLRRQLAGVRGDSAPVVTRPPGYLLELDRRDLDLHVFEDLLDRGRTQLETGDAEGASSTLREALELWRGDPLGDLGSYAFAREEAARLEELRLAAVSERIESDLACGRETQVLRELETLVAAHPLRERFRAQLMLALYRAGRQADALQAYQDARRALVTELGLEPGKPLQLLEQQILTQDAALDLPKRELSPPPVHPSPRRTRRRRTLALLGLIAAVALVVALVTFGRNDDTSPGLTAIAPNSVGVIDPERNRLVAEIPVGATPKGVVAGAGAIWIANSEDGTLSRIDPKRRVVLRTITLPGDPSDAAFNGSVWVLHLRGGSSSSVDPYAGLAAVSEVNPHFDSIARTINIPAGFGNTYEDPIAVGTGSVWVAGPTGVSRIEAESGRVHDRLSLPDVIDLVVQGGTTWVLEWSGTLVHLDPSGDFVASSISLSSTSNMKALAAGYGSLWAVGERRSAPQGAQARHTASLFRVDPRNGEVSAKLGLDGSPTAVAVGHGAVWIADAERREVLRIDPKAMRVLAHIMLGARPTSLAADDDAVWVTVT